MVGFIFIAALLKMPYFYSSSQFVDDVAARGETSSALFDDIKKRFYFADH